MFLALGLSREVCYAICGFLLSIFHRFLKLIVWGPPRTAGGARKMDITAKWALPRPFSAQCERETDFVQKKNDRTTINHGLRLDFAMR